MNLKDIKQLIDHIDQSTLTEFSWSKDGERVVLKKEKEIMTTVGSVPSVQYSSAPVPQQVSVSPDSENKPVIKSNLKEITSPMVGTFYGAPSPDASDFVKVGDSIQAGQVVCIVEAMKLMNEIESDVSGTITEICATNAHPVEYGSILFKVKPN